MRDSIVKPSEECETLPVFKRGVLFKALEQAVLLGEDLRERTEEEESGFRKLELESDQGS